MTYGINPRGVDLRYKNRPQDHGTMGRGRRTEIGAKVSAIVRRNNQNNVAIRLRNARGVSIAIPNGLPKTRRSESRVTITDAPAGTCENDTGIENAFHFLRFRPVRACF